MSFFKNTTFKLFLTLILFATLILVIVFGQKKLETQASLIKAEISKIEKSNLNKEISSGIKYKGSNSVGALDNNRWKNKNWIALGDNITAKNSYQSGVKFSCGMGNVSTYASMGNLMKDTTKDIDSNKLKDADIITVFSGTSDYSLNTPLGTINDDENSNTFYGDLHKTIKKILELKDDATIVFFTPLKRGKYKNYAVYPNANEAGVKLEDYAQAIKDVCSSYNILVLDLFKDSGIDESNIKKYTVDGLHLNNSGSKKLIKTISDYLNTIK